MNRTGPGLGGLGPTFASLRAIAAVSASLFASAASHADGFRLQLEDDAVPIQLPASSPSLAADAAEIEPYFLGGSDFSGITVLVAGARLNWFVADHVSVGCFFEGAHVNQVGENAMGGGAGILLRWHFMEKEDMSAFVELGIGFTAFDDPVPEIATAFDFSPRAAIGARWALSDDAMLTAQIGWLHFSNAQTGEENPGVDMLAIGLGVRFEF